jgi:hypothetical protein
MIMTGPCPPAAGPKGSTGANRVRSAGPWPRRPEPRPVACTGDAAPSAVEGVLAQIADSGDRERVRAGLKVCFTRPPGGGAGCVGGAELRAAVAAQVDLLRQMGDGSWPFFELVSVDPDWLSGPVAEAFVAALERVVAASSITEAVHQIRYDRLEDLIRALVRAFAARAPAREERLVVGVVPLSADGFEER